MKAKLLSPLVYFDGPQVALLHARKMHVIAVAIEKDDMEYPFFCCRVYKNNWQRYMDGKADLHFLFANAAMDSYYFFDWNQINDDGFVDLVKATDEEASNLEYWPEKGFFSSSHTELVNKDPIDVTSKTFNIDGSWDANEFSSFYGKMSDVYAIFVAENRLSTAPANDNVSDKIKNSVLRRLWQGGGSYSGFYNALEQNIPDMEPLKVTRIQYASPGEIELRGQSEIFSEMLNSFANFECISRQAEAEYQFINKMLSKEKLKAASPDSTFSTDEKRDIAKGKADILMECVGLNEFNKFYEACDKNDLVYIKLVMSIYRRFKGVFNFMSEGRVDAVTQ